MSPKSTEIPIFAAISETDFLQKLAVDKKPFILISYASILCCRGLKGFSSVSF